jgi:hypothetical protein
MIGMYDRLAQALEGEDEAGEAARAVLIAMRQAGSEVLQAGIDAAQWTAAIDGLLRAADAADQASRMKEVQARKKQWPSVRRHLEKLGCQVWQLTSNIDRWRIEGPGVDVEVDLVSGKLAGLEEGPYDAHWTTEDLQKMLETTIRSRMADEAAEARKRKLRDEHSWVNGKGWVPKSGDGPIIRAGGSAPA